jgi:hypothetical protein
MYQPLAHLRHVSTRLLQRLILAFVFICVTGGANSDLAALCSTKSALWCYCTHITYAASLSSAAANADFVYVGATLSGEVFCTLTTAPSHHISSYISKHKPTSLERAHFRPDRPRYPSQDSTMLAYDTHPFMDVSATADGKLGYTAWQRDASLSCQVTTKTATLSALKTQNKTI